MHKLAPCHTIDRDCSEPQGGLWWETEKIQMWKSLKLSTHSPFSMHYVLHKRQLLLLLGSLWHYNWYLAFIHDNNTHFTLNCRENFWRQGISDHHECILTWKNSSYLYKVQAYRKICHFNALITWLLSGNSKVWFLSSKTWWMKSPWCQTVCSINSEGPIYATQVQ